MQGTNSGAGKPKRPKLAASEPEVNQPEVNESAPSESAPNGPTDEKSIISELTIDDSLITEPAVNDSNKTDEIPSRFDVNTTKHGDETIGQQIEGDLHTITHDDGMAILDEYFPNSPVDSGPMDDALALDTLLRLGDEGVHQNSPLTTT